MVRILSIVGDAAASVVMEGASRKLLISNKMMFVIVHSIIFTATKKRKLMTAALGQLLPIERALETDLMSILAVYQQYYFNTN